MPLYEFLIACADEPEAHRKKEGDVVAVRPHPFNWGRKEIDRYFIVIIDMPEDIETLRSMFESCQYAETNEFQPEDDSHLTKLAKNRFKIPLDIVKTGWMPDLDLGKVRDKKIIYQPFKKTSQLISKLDLQEKDVDCASIVSSKEAEFSIDPKEPVSLIWDKDKDSFKYPTVKVFDDGK